MYVHAYTLYSAVRPFGCRWVQILSSHLSMLYLVTAHTIHWQLRSGETRDGMMTDCGFAHWTEPQWCHFSWLSDLSLCPRAWAHSNALLAFIFLLFLKGLLVSYVFHLLLVVCCLVIVLLRPRHWCFCLDSFILGSHDKDDGPQLYMVDPSGISYVSYYLIRSLK